MRRKSERNKAKASPEKKVEKPTRKSTRRRAKKSPSTSPERDNSNDTDRLQATDKESLYKIQTRLHSKEVENINDEPETKVSSTEVITEQQDVEDSGSVWKAARADASPGEIPKLKLCRQRNLSETSDISLNRKRTSKWQESGESGVAEEADSADERPASSLMTIAGNEPADNPSSTIPGRDSGEEVSDNKEFPPEISSADLSDNKPNIDRHDDTIESTNCTAATKVDSKQDTVSDTKAEMFMKMTNVDANGEQQQNNEITIRDEKAILETQQVLLDLKKIQSEVNVESESKLQLDEKPTAVEEEKKEEINQKDTSSDDDEEERKKTVIERLVFSDNSNDEELSENVKRASRGAVRLSRRKHRDKYRDSSNSESADSDEEPTIDKKIDETKGTLKEISSKQQNNKETGKCAESETEISPSQNESNIIEMIHDPVKKEGEEETKMNLMTEKVAHLSDLVVYTSVNKSAKVNLKRTFAARLSIDRSDVNKDNTDVDAATQDKENHVCEDQVESNIIPKKRRWGTAVNTDVTPTFSISTDFLKILVPGAKPLPISEVRLTKDDDEERNRRKDREKRYSVTDGPAEKSKTDADSAKLEALKNDNHIASRRKISIVKDISHANSPSPPPSQLTNILLIKNLVRPFTLNQIKELLSRTGTIIENGFWMDRIKSKCFVEYSNEDQAFETRQALHGISWPPSNPKKLSVEYASKEDIDEAKESSKDQMPLRKAELPETVDVWQQEWGKDGKSSATTKVTVVREWDLGKEDGQNLMKDKEREKKEIDKKRRQRSRSPGLDTHLPAPARKFKKKEDEPPPAKLLDDLFRKTKATPCIYWLPLTNEQIVVKEEMRQQRMAEYACRLEEMRRAGSNRDGRRRRSPRK